MGSFGLYLGYLNYQETLKYWGRDDKYIKKNLGEGVNSIFFAIVVATVSLHHFQGYTILPALMEKSLMVGDFLFVSALRCARPYDAAFPAVSPQQSTICRSAFLQAGQIPYLRLPAIAPVKVGDPVVFNYPWTTCPWIKRKLCQALCRNPWRRS